MNRFRFRRLEKYRVGGASGNMRLAIPLPKSPKGRIQRYCPSPDCTPRRFQLGDAPADQLLASKRVLLARRTPGSPGVSCPYCGTDGADEDFLAPEDKKAATKYVEWAVHQDAGDYLDQMARDFNRKAGRGPFISLNMQVKRSRMAPPYTWREDLLRGLICDTCGRSYGVYAIALFCPDCGAPNIHVHFAREVALIEKQVMLSENAGNDGDEELAYRLLGNAHEDVLTALETYLRTLFVFLAKTRCDEQSRERLLKETRRGNPFQSVTRTRELYAELGVDPFRMLPDADRAFLVLHIEKRHVIGHNLGLADEKYLKRTGAGDEGESVSLIGSEIRRFAEIAYTVVVKALEETEAEFRATGSSTT